MTLFKKIEKLSPAEVREYVKSQSSDEAFISEIIEQKETLVPLLLKSKALPEVVITKLGQEPVSANFLLDELINASYTPSFSFIEALASFGDFSDDSVLKALKSFPTVPISVQFLLKIINHGLIESGIFLVNSKPEFQKPEILMLLLKTGTSNDSIIEKSMKFDSIKNEVVKEINQRNGSIFSKECLSWVITTFENPAEIGSEGLDLNLTSAAYAVLIKNERTVNRGNRQPIYSHWRATTTVKWSKEFEELEERDFPEIFSNEPTVRVTSVPSGSKYRQQWLKVSPKEGSDEELLEALDSIYANEYIATEIVSRSFALLKKVNIDRLIEFISPTKLATRVKSDPQKALYLFNEVPSKYTAALRKVLPADIIPEEKNLNKRSYFVEAFQAIQNRDIESFQLALSKGYSIQKFVEDSHQSSKKRSCEIKTISSKFLMALTKEEFLIMCQTPFNFDLGTYGEMIKLKYSFTAKEALDSSEKIRISICFLNCNEKLAFLKDKKLSIEDTQTIFEDFKTDFISDPKLLKAYLGKVKNSDSEEIEFSSEILKSLAEIMTSKELRAFTKIESIPEKQMTELKSEIDLKCSDGVYFIKDEELLSLLNDRYLIESDDFINKVINRNESLAKQIVEAYLNGNKALSELSGVKVSIKRQDIDKFKKISNDLKLNNKDVVDEIFTRGGLLSDFKENIYDWRKYLEKYSDGREIRINKIRSAELFNGEFDLNKNLKFSVDELEYLQYRGYHSEEDDEDDNRLGILPNVKIKKITISSYDAKLSKFIQDNKIEHVSIGSIDLDDKVRVLMDKKIVLSDRQSVLSSIMVETEGLGKLELKHLAFLEKNGLILTDQIVLEILDSYDLNKETIIWLAERLGSLERFTLNQKEVTRNDDNPENLAILIKNGAEVLADDEFKIRQKKDDLVDAGINFESFSVEDISVKEKLRLIQFIENKIDPNYKKLNLASSNLDMIKLLQPYHEMRTVNSLDDNDFIKSLNIPPNVANNKRLMKGIRDLLAVRSDLSCKIAYLKSTINIINPKIDMKLSDFIDISNEDSVVENEYCTAIKFTTVASIYKNESLINSQGLILKHQDKTKILRFLRSASSKDGLEDTLSMISQVLRGLEAQKERILNIDDEAQKDELIDSIAKINERLEEIAAMDDVTHMHDRLVPLLSFIKSDPTQPLGQDKFKKLEKGSIAVEVLGFNLFFPKTRGELSFLGDHNDWCVNNDKTYADGVITNGNILVGICEKDSPATKENVIALAHFMKRENGDYYLEQLKWSIRKQDGRKNVDGTKSFDHKAILSVILDHLMKHGSKDKKN